MSTKEIFAKEIHKQALKKFPRRKVFARGIDNIWGIDLSDMNMFMKYNDDYRYILCVIDVFSKYAWCIPLKNKSAATVLNAVKSLIQQSHRTPQRIWVDKGSEFYNKKFEEWVKSNDIIMYSTYGESKSVIVERFQRTLKDMFTKQFTIQNTRNWVKLLPDVLKDYNNRVHSTIGMSPVEASKPENEVDAYIYMYPDDGVQKKKHPRFEVGDEVRISRVKGIFEKGMENNFSFEVFKISKVLDTQPITYHITDYNGDVIEGSFYEQELLKTTVPDYYEIEKIIETRKVGKKKQSFVKFVGWPKKFSMWLNEDDIYDIPKK